MVDNQLAYIDQASFLALRANGHGPMQQLVVVYDHDMNIGRLREVHRNLGFTLLGRRIEKSALPFGRHRWVAAPDQSDMEITPPRSRSELMSWMDEQAARGVDPERGPAWRMVVVTFTEGGGAITLLVSHSVADVGGILASVYLALSDTKAELDYPKPDSRGKMQALREDWKEFRRALPEIKTAFNEARAVIRESKSGSADGGLKPARAVRPVRGAVDTMAFRPTVCAAVPLEEWDERAKELNGNPGALVAGFAARLGFLMGQVRPDGSVQLNFPVSERKKSDTRANALNGMSVNADPNQVLSDLDPLFKGMSTGLRQLFRNRRSVLAPIPLAVVTPKRVVRRLEHLVLGDGPIVGCTNMGDVPAELAEIDGTPPDFILARGVEWPISRAELDRIGNWILVGSCRISGKVMLFVTAWQAGTSNTREQLQQLVSQGLVDFKLKGTFL